MPQFRLTSKMATELKVTELSAPISSPNRLYDDWYLDVTRILRKKVFIFMHVDTRIGLAIPVYEIGGTHGLFECFSLLLREFLNQLDYEKVAEEAYDFFNIPLAQMSFTKTDNKSLLRYVSDFKHILEFKARKKNDISQVLCDLTSEYWLNHLMKDPLDQKDYTTPLSLIRDLFGKGYS